MNKVGIVSYGSYIPRYYHKVNHRSGVIEQRVAHPYENSVTMGYHAGLKAINRAGINKNDIGSIWVATETKTNKVGADSIIIADKLGLSKRVEVMDVELACASGLASIIKACRETSHPDFNGKYSLVITTDCSRIKEGAFRSLVGHGATGFLIGPKPLINVSTNGVAGFTSYQNDFFVTHKQPCVPVCNGRKSIHEYKRHTYGSLNQFLENGLDTDYFIIHAPVPKIIDWITFNERDGFTDNPFKDLSEEEVRELFKYNSITAKAGNTFPSSFALNLINWFDHAVPGEQVIGVNYGSGSTALTARFEANEKINSYDRSVKLEDKLVTDPRFELDDNLFDHYMKGELPSANDFRGNDFAFEELTNAQLVYFNRDKSLIRLSSGEGVIAEVVGCSNLAPGTILEPSYKQLELPSGEIKYKLIVREKLKYAGA